MRGSQSVHDTLCQKVASELKDRGWEVMLHEHYKFGKVCGEMDVLGTKYGKFMYVECKSNPTPAAYKKADKQLDRAKKYPFRDRELYTMMAYWDDGKPRYEWRK